MCGEKRPLGFGALFGKGSPPRVRGKAFLRCMGTYSTRITPACAGKSTSIKHSRTESWDHPRVCGEKSSSSGKSTVNSGSPPRVRGKVCRQHHAEVDQRITPACAGKRLKKAHKIKDFDPVPIRFHLVFRRFERWCSNLPTPDGNVPV